MPRPFTWSSWRWSAS